MKQMKITSHKTLSYSYRFDLF